MRTIQRPSIQCLIEKTKDTFFNKLRRENIRRIRLISIAGFLYLFLFIGLDYLRFQAGKIEVGNIYFYLFINHLCFGLFAIPLLIIQKNKTDIITAKWKYSSTLIMGWTIFSSLLLTSLATLSLIERGSLMMYTLHVILINFCVLMLPKERALINLTSFFIITIACFVLYQDNLEKLLLNLLEIAGITIPGYIVSSQIFTSFVRETHNEKVLEEKSITLAAHKQKADNLLHNILPVEIATELKNNGFVKPKHYSSATIMMIDFKNFSKISRALTPEQLVSDLDYCFKKMDAIIGDCGLEKIKTIGDAYLCVGGVPNSNLTHPFDTIKAAQKILEFLEGWKDIKKGNKEPYFEGRIGIHTGPVIAGVVGDKKIAFDIWGDSVNIAASLEAKGAVGQINISESTYQLIYKKVSCTYRGKIPTKNLDPIDMYFVD